MFARPAQILGTIEERCRLVDDAEEKPLRELRGRLTHCLSRWNADMANDKYEIRDDQKQVERVNPECAVDIQFKPFDVALSIDQPSPK